MRARGGLALPGASQRRGAGVVPRRGRFPWSAWYRWHEPKWRGWSWNVQWPEENQEFKFIEIPKRSLRLLVCDEARGDLERAGRTQVGKLYHLR